MTRRQLRESIFKILFQVEFNKREEWEEQLSLYLDGLKTPAHDAAGVIDDPQAEEDEQGGTKTEAPMQVTDLDLAYITQKVKGIYEKLPELDEAIAESTEGWNLNRIGKAELAILRVAVYELKFDEDVPEGVAINEAVELAKIYCAEDAKGFVIAVLAKFAK